MTLRALPLVVALLLGGGVACDGSPDTGPAPSPSSTAINTPASAKGLRVTASSQVDAAGNDWRHVLFVLDITDDDALGADYVLYAMDFGDGTGEHSGSRRIASCAVNASPRPPLPLSKRIERPHWYNSPGTYKLTVIVTTYKTCNGPPDETRTATTTVTVSR